MEQQQHQQDETPALQRPTPLPASLVSNKKKTAEDAVDDLERRLQMLGAPALTDSASGTSTTESVTTNASSTMAAAPAAVATPAPAAAAPAPAPAAAPAPAIPIMGAGKNALLARIKAAQERAKHPAAATTSSSSTAAPPPPPMKNQAMTQQPLAPPPTSDPFAPPSMMDMMMTTTTTTMAPPAAAATPAAMSFDPFAAPSNKNSASPENNNSAMFFDPSSAPGASLDSDLLGNHQHQQQQVAPPAPQQQQQPHEEEESLESILAALEGLSEQEKQALLAEQGKIMASIEKTKVSSADARANAFEQRSLAGALRAPAINIDASAATAAGLTAEETEQLKADMALAEQLQREEYDQAERENSERAERRRRTQQQQSSSSSSPQQRHAAGAAAHEPGWMEWLGLAASSAPAPPAHLAEIRRPLQRGEIGVSLPPGSSIRRAGGGDRPVGSPVRTSGAGAEHTITFTPSYDDADRAEDAAFLRNRGSTPAARVAERQPLFSCVADSITSAATAVSTALQMTEDDEGNVIGVDSSGLLDSGGGASSPGRDSNDNNESTTPYSRAG